MSTYDRRSVQYSSDDRVCRCEDVRAILFCQGRVADSVNVFGRSSLRPQFPPTSGKFVAASEIVGKYISHFKSFLDLRQFKSMHQDGEKLDLIDASFGATYETALGVSKMFARIWANDPFLADVSDGSYDIYTRCPKEHCFFARLSHYVTSKQKTSGLSDSFKNYSVLNRPYDRFPFRTNVSRWGRDCNFESRMQVRLRPVSVGCHKVNNDCSLLVCRRRQTLSHFAFLDTSSHSNSFNPFQKIDSTVVFKNLVGVS